MRMLLMAVKREGSVTVVSDSIFGSTNFSPSILNPVRVFSMAFPLFTFAVNLTFIIVKAFTFLLFIAFNFKFCVLCWSFSLSLFVFGLSLSLLLFEERFPLVEGFVFLCLLIFRNCVCKNVERLSQCADCFDRKR